ncbi:MAG: MBL fold metallo-hydrolase [Candidatus Thorarchaeota archaeon]|nr:MBL fold metallo-hydrolase [Candidatus Thorarchaeota archaeon]
MYWLLDIEVHPQVSVISGGAFPQCNSLVILGDEITVVDPGCQLENLRMFLAKHGHRLHDIDAILLSHIHPDHITHAARIQKLSLCRIMANEITAPLYNNKEEMKRFLGFARSNSVRPLWEELVNTKMYGALDEGTVDVILRDDERLSLGDITLKMFYTPGHLPDHMCIELLEANLLFAADIDCTEFGPYYGHPNSSIPDFIESIDEVKRRQYSGIISGHLKQPLISEYGPALDAYSRLIEVREDLVLAAVSGGKKTIEEIARTPIIYPSHPSPVFLQFEIWMIEHHIDSLLSKGLIERKREQLKAV